MLCPIWFGSWRQHAATCGFLAGRRGTVLDDNLVQTDKLAVKFESTPSLKVKSAHSTVQIRRAQTGCFAHLSRWASTKRCRRCWRLSPLSLSRVICPHRRDLLRKMVMGSGGVCSCCVKLRPTVPILKRSSHDFTSQLTHLNLIQFDSDSCHVMSCLPLW